MFYIDHFRDIEKDFPNFKFNIALSEPQPEDNWDGYVGFIQRISGTNAAVLFDNYSPWEKMVTFPIKDLEEGGIGPK